MVVTRSVGIPAMDAPVSCFATLERRLMYSHAKHGNEKKLAVDLMADITTRGKIPLLIGGTMLYFNALFYGLATLPEANSEIRKKLDLELQQQGKQVLYQRLTQIDPQAANRIHPNDPQRIQRALEVFEISGKPISHFFAQARQERLPYRQIKLIIAPEDRKLLHEKIAQRFYKMLQQGLLEEVNGLFLRGDLDETRPAIRAVGYRQVWAYLQNEYDLEMMTDKSIAATRQLAKRQFTWLRKEEDAIKFVTGDDRLLEKVCQLIRNKKQS